MPNSHMSTGTALADANSGSGYITRRLLIAVLVFIAVIALAALLPRTLPGEMSSGELTAHAGAPCVACPPTDQIRAAGIAAAEDGVYVNVRFDAPPLNTLLRISFDGIPGELDLQQSGKSWRYAGRGNSMAPRPTRIMSRDNKVVLTFPPTLRAAGVAVSTGTGDHLPRSGYVSPTYPAPAHFNATDVVLLLALALTAWYGFTRGFVLEVVDLVVLGISLAIAALAYRPVAQAVADITSSATVGAVVGGVLMVVVISFGGLLLVKRYLPKVATMTGPFDGRVNSILGGVTGCLRQLPVLAMLLAAGTDLTVLHWASRSVGSSLLGSALIHAWRAAFSIAQG